MVLNFNIKDYDGESENKEDSMRKNSRKVKGSYLLSILKTHPIIRIANMIPNVGLIRPEYIAFE